jgi:hypothetical protein
MSSPSGSRSTLDRLRGLILALLTFGLIATGVDLVLLEHYEDARQLIPLGIIGLAVATIAWHVVAGGAASLLALRVVMTGGLVAGALGMVFHFQGNMGFQLDMNPDIGAWDLVWRVLHAKAPPALAPGAMAQLGLLGLIYCYRHPAASSEAGANR